MPPLISPLRSPLIPPLTDPLTPGGLAWEQGGGGVTQRVDYRLSFGSRTAQASGHVGAYANVPDNSLLSQTAALSIYFKAYVPVVAGLTHSLRGIFSQWNYASAATSRLSVVCGNTDAGDAMNYMQRICEVYVALKLGMDIARLAQPSNGFIFGRVM